MPVEQAGQNAVVLGQSINPSIFSQLWLVREKLIAEDEFREGTVFAPGIAQFSTRLFQFMAMPDRVQVTPDLAATNAAEIIKNTLGKIVDLLPHTPYTAAGLNFSYRAKYPGRDFAKICRDLFCGNNVISSDFDSADARFGAYYSKNAAGSRMKVDIKPVTVGDGSQHLSIQFNFAIDRMPKDAVKAIAGLFDSWDEAKGIADDISTRIGGV